MDRNKPDDKHDDKHEAHEAAPAKKEGPPDQHPTPKPTKEQIIAALLASYQRNMESASPRTLEELQMIRDLIAAK